MCLDKRESAELDDDDDHWEREANVDGVAMADVDVISERIRRNLVVGAVGVRVVLVLWALVLCVARFAGKHPASIGLPGLMSAALFGVAIGAIIDHRRSLEVVRLRDTSVVFTAVLFPWKRAAVSRYADRLASLRVPEFQAAAMVVLAVAVGVAPPAFSAGMVYVAVVLIYLWATTATRARVAAG